TPPERMSASAASPLEILARSSSCVSLALPKRIGSAPSVVTCEARETELLLRTWNGPGVEAKSTTSSPVERIAVRGLRKRRHALRQPALPLQVARSRGENTWRGRLCPRTVRCRAELHVAPKGLRGPTLRYRPGAEYIRS